MARPTVLTEENILELEKRFRDGATTLEAIDGIFSEATYYLHLKENTEFSERMELAREYVTEIARGVVARRVKKGDAESAKWWLERRNKAQFSPKTELDANLTGNITIQTIDYSNADSTDTP